MTFSLYLINYLQRQLTFSIYLINYLQRQPWHQAIALVTITFFQRCKVNFLSHFLWTTSDFMAWIRIFCAWEFRSGVSFLSLVTQLVLSISQVNKWDDWQALNEIWLTDLSSPSVSVGYGQKKTWAFVWSNSWYAQVKMTSFFLIISAEYPSVGPKSRTLELLQHLFISLSNLLYYNHTCLYPISNL